MEDFQGKISLKVYQLDRLTYKHELNSIRKKKYEFYFDVAVVEIARRFCRLVNSSIDEAEFISIENEGTKKNKKG